MILSSLNVHKTYGDQVVLHDCSLTVKAGQCVLLRGPSGGGKSTLLRILALLEPATRGQVTHGSRCWDVSRLPKASAYPFVTLLFQQLFLWPNLTMGQNLSIVLKHRPNFPLSQTDTDLLERLKIVDLIKRYPHECSLGQRQRLAIARALLSEARFLLLDEPSSALDRANQGILLQELKAAIALGRGVLLITHDDRGYEDIADQSFELENGILRRR